MAVTENLYTGDGSTVLYSFTFPYLATSDVKVSLNGTDTTAYSLANATQVQLNTAPASGVAVRVYRSTSDTSLSAEFFPGAAIKSSDLNNNFNQTLYVTQESNALVSDAVTKANNATAAVADAVFYTPIANVAAIPGSPSNNDRIEILDSTNVQSTSGVNTSSLPSGFTGSSVLTIRLEYSSGAWQFKQYFATDPEARYYPKASGTANASSIATNTANISTNTSNISTNTGNISTNTSNIATNTSNISNNSSNIATNAANISTNTGNISTNTSDISTNTSAIAANASSISTNASNISTNTSNISSNTSSIATKMPIAGGTFTGNVSFDDDVIIRGDSTNGSGKITLNCESNDHAIKIKGPPHSASADYTLTLPNGTGSNGNALVTDGSGNLSWGSPTADVSGKADLDDPDFTGTPTCPTPQTGSTNTEITNCGWVKNEISSDISTKANLASPQLTGTPTSTTPGTSDNSTKIATTAYVQGERGNTLQAYSARLNDISGLSTTNGNIIVGDGSTWVSEGGTDARASLGLTIGTHVQAQNARLNDISNLGTNNNSFIVADGNNLVLKSATDARTAMGVSDVTLTGTPNYLTLSNQEITQNAINLATGSSHVTGTLPIASGGTGATTASTALTELGAEPADTTIVKTGQTNTFTYAQSFDDVYIGGVYTGNVTSANASVDCSAGNYFECELTANNVITYAFTNVPSTSNRVYSFTLKLKLNGGTISTSAFPNSVKWAGGSAPTLTANKTHLLFFVTPDQGTTFYASALTDFTN